MAGPPETIEPCALFQELMAMPRPGRAVDIPRTNPATGKPVGKVWMQILTEQEQMACAAAAEDVTRTLLKTVPKAEESRRGYDAVYDNAAACELLFRACKDVTDPTHKRAFFPSPTQMRATLTSDELGVFVLSYQTVQAELGPILSTMPPEEVDAWVKVIGEGGSRLPFDLLSSGALKDLAFSLALRQWTSQTLTLSAGSPPESGSDDSTT